jgi:hypothetical protein
MTRLSFAGSATTSISVIRPPATVKPKPRSASSGHDDHAGVAVDDRRAPERGEAASLTGDSLAAAA